MKKLRNSSRGFTLIEMLIVVAIIGILASVVLVGLGPVQRRGRDARRIADLRQVQTGLELYFSKNGSYPATSGNWQGLVTALTGADIGIKNIPSDPRGNASPYQYGVSEDGTSYVLGARLEDGSNPALNDDPNGLIYGVNCDNPVYCVEF